MLTMLLFSAAMIAASPQGQIAYISGSQQEDHCVVVLDVASGDQTRVGMGQRDSAPMWSPNGQWLAFTSVDNGKTQLRMVRPDGSEPRALSAAADSIRWPRWSPDGAHIAYAAGNAFTAKAMVYDVATNTEAEWGGGRSGMFRPVWLDAEDLAAVAVKGLPGQYTTELLKVTRAEAAPLLIDLRAAPDKYCEWCVEPSPKGALVAFESNDGGDREVFVASAKLGLHDVSNHRAADWNPVWAPDAKWLAFESFRGGRRGVYRVFVDTARVFPVAVTKDSDNWAPAWSPDGENIAFVSDRTGDPEIYVVDADGKSEPVRLTKHAGDDFAPAWRPVGKSK